MSDQIFIREVSLIGEQSYQKLKNARIAVFGLGGVGSYVVEALARAGVGHLLICDNDVIAPHNINRQLFALHSTLGRRKVDVACERLKDINPEISVEIRAEKFCKETEESYNFSGYDYVIDCIDLVTHKLLLALKAQREGTPIISCMGTGNKLDCEFKVADIYQTKMCPLCAIMRKELRRREVKSLTVVYSEEVAQKPLLEQEGSKRRQTPASISYVPSSAGLLIAGEVIKNIIKG